MTFICYPITIHEYNCIPIYMKYLHNIVNANPGISRRKMCQKTTTVKNALVVSAFLQLSTSAQLDPPIEIQPIRWTFNPDDPVRLQ